MPVSVAELAARLERMESRVEEITGGVEQDLYYARRSWVMRILARYERLQSAIRAARLSDETHIDSVDDLQIEERNFCLDIESALRGLIMRGRDEWRCHRADAGVLAKALIEMTVFSVPPADPARPYVDWSLGAAARHLRIDHKLAGKLLARAIDFLWADLADYRE